ncbi:MAG: hypothetical protein IT374_21990 [Polyangiaceae bacterium]|nr:hypothetical protein [Polyangiaceae bacterium]
MRSLVTRSLAGCLAVAALAVAPPAGAVGTRTFELTSQDDFMQGGDLHGVAVDSQGRLRAGWNLGTVTLSGISSVLSALELSDGSVLLGTGSNGKVMRLSGGKVDEYADTKEMGVTAMVTDGRTVYAATLKGKIWKLEGAGKASELVSIPDGDHILALAWDAKKKGFYAATGPHGKLFFVAPGSAPSLVFDSDETQLSAVTVGDDGAVYAGSTGKGLVFKITGPGRATIVLNPPGDEIKALAMAKGGGVFVVANEVGASSEPNRRLGPTIGAPGGGAPPPTTGRPRAGKGALWKIDPDGRAEELFARKDTHFISLAVDEAGAPYVGTAAEGRVFTVDDNHTSTLVADVDSRQIGALVLTGKTKVVVGSDPAVVHEIRGTGGDDATWTSRVLDTGSRAMFGRLFWRADGQVEMAARTGNSPTPDATWSEWSAMLTAPAKPNVPPARFIQVRARFSKGGAALLRSVEVPYTADNVRAVVTTIEARPRGAHAGSMNTQSGPPLPGAPASASPQRPSGSDVPPRAGGVRLSWRVDNPDGDQLRYRLSFRFDGHAAWRDLTRPDDVLTRSDLDWDTASLPEGIYRVRVEATDETANPPDRVTRHALESGPILVDNTPPVFRGLSAAGRRVKADIVDGLGPIARIDFAVDGHTEWRPLLPKDGVLDEPTEEVDADLSSVLSAGPHLIAVRAFDKAGNQVVRDVEMK